MATLLLYCTLDHAKLYITFHVQFVVAIATWPRKALS